MHKHLVSQLSGSRVIVFLLIGLLSFLSACKDERPQMKAGEISNLHEFAGTQARLVWVQDILENKDVSARGNHLSLMGFDSEDGQGERVILPGPENFYRPLITPSGQQVVFSDFNRHQIHVVDWSGQNRRDLTRGRALAVWRNPADGVDWVYVGRSAAGYEKSGSTQLYRVQLDNPSIEELMWDRMPFGDAVHVSGDGRYFSAEIANADCALIDTASGQARRYGKGCWPAVSSGQSFRFWFFDGAHRNLEMVDMRQGTRSRIHLAEAPGVDGHEVYHPRWSNSPRFMVMTGPYTIRQGGNNIRGGGAGIEVYAGRFNKKYTEIEAWFQVTRNQRADFYPDMWVAQTENSDLENVPQQEIVSTGNSPVGKLHWPVVNGQLLFAWENAAAENEWTGLGGQFYQAKIVAEGMARFSLNFQMDIKTGWYGADRLPKLEPAKYKNAEALTLEFVVTLPTRKDQADGVVLSLGGESSDQTILRYEQGTLVLEDRGTGRDVQVTQLGQLPAGRSHVVLSLEPDQVLLQVNDGAPGKYPRKISSVTAWPLFFGDFKNKEGTGWNGLLEHVALYGGKLDSREKKRLLQNYMQIRKTVDVVEPVIVRAELLSASTVPSPEDILPYRRGLVVDEYRITELLQGDLKDQDILVARWAILNGERIAEADREVGKVYELRLDLFDNRPELEGERLSMESDNLLLPMYYQLDF